MGMFSPVKPGSWCVRSEKDSRWNKSGTDMVGSFMMPKAAEDWVEKQKKELGEEPPDDLQFSYMKD